MNRIASLLSVLLLVSWLPGEALAAAAEATDEPPLETMDQIFEALTVLLPASLDPDRFADPAQRPAIERALAELVRSADELQEHGAKKSESFGYLSRSLSEDVHAIQEHYARERYPEARFLLHLLTDTCFACHSRLPSDEGFPFAEQLLGRPELQNLSAQETARLQVATRQFSAALDTYERIFADLELPPAQMDLVGYFVDYLSVSLRVLRDFERPIPVLERVAARDDTDLYLRRRLQGWVRSLVELRDSGGVKPSLEQALGLIRKAQSVSEVPRDRDGLVYDLAASAALHQLVEATPAENKALLSEAYYWLGVTESRSRRNYWVSETELYLEASIRLAPKSELAREAYALLEEYTVFGYTGSAGEHVPREVRAKLDELRALIYTP